MNRNFRCLLGMCLLIFSDCTVNKDLPDPLLAGWNGQSVCELLEENKRMRVLKCTFAPGVGHERHYHDPHFGYALSGSTFRITDTTGTREVVLKTGSYFTSEGVAWHEVLNIGDSTAVYIIFETK
ncbi:MAG: cupin domain-containing protein [Bacteroidia bacterium]|nr:cupin domain-containing protein [Bacteroidia bacterium]